MLIEFKVKGFKNFKEELIFNLGNVNKYSFGEKAIKNETVKTGLVYGINGSGKSNLGIALFDIILHLTDKEKQWHLYNNYLNLFNGVEKAEFTYKFKFEKDIVEYKYLKMDSRYLLEEEFKINNKLITYYNYEKNTFQLNLLGTESLRTDLNGSSNSFIKFVYNNSNPQSIESEIIGKFFKFVENMLFFASLNGNYYQGFKNGDGKISEEIIKAKKLKDFENFLKKAGIEYKLKAVKEGNENKIHCVFDNKSVDFFAIASKGTTSLALFYAWLIRLNEASFVFIDEFDAFYHVDLAKKIVEELLELDIQAILTTHDTTLMSNELLRPDCYFIISDGRIKSLPNITEKELRFAHNLEKMYRAGAFDDGE